MADGHTETATSQDFEEKVYRAVRPVLVDFWAAWCEPCKQVSPILEEIAREYADKLSVVKVNVDENPDVAMDCQVRSIPTLALFVDGKLIRSLPGARPKENILGELANVLT